MAGKIFIKLGMLGVIIVLMNVIYAKTLYPKDLHDTCEEILKLKQEQDSTDVFYFGESSNFTSREDDSTKQSISELIALFYPSLKLTSINKAATHAGIYKYWLNQISTAGRLPKAVIVTLNLRSFDAAWRYSELETQLQESVTLVKPYPPVINRFFLSLQAFDNKTPQQREQQMLKEWETTVLKFPSPFKYTTVREWDNAMAAGGYVKADGSWDNEKIALACHYIKAYAFNLNEENQRVKDFDEMAAWCDNHQVNLYFNLMAENTEYADSLVGKELVFLMKQNRDFLVKRYQKNKCMVVDNLELIPGKEFIDQHWTTEHYGYKGRMQIAKQVATTLTKQFSKEYKNAY